MRRLYSGLTALLSPLRDGPREAHQLLTVEIRQYIVFKKNQTVVSLSYGWYLSRGVGSCLLPLSET